jgi:hypothetical protein
MGTGLDISRRFCEQVVLPLLRSQHPEMVDRVAIGVAGTGSDVLGLDDEVSRDHHWGPRAAVLLADDDVDDFGDAIRLMLSREFPSAFEGHAVRFDPAHRTGVCVDGISSYLAWFLGTGRMPERDEDWFSLCETDLLHVTSGEVFHDPPGRWTAVRKQLAYYPDRVWRKRIADWCMYVTGRDAPYNLNRVGRRGDLITSHIYFGQAIRRVMELGCAIERRYAPYPKWQLRLFRTLGGCAPRVLPTLEALNATHDWKAQVDGLIEINRVYADRLHELGLASRPVPQAFDEGLTDLTLYASAKELYESLPPAWREVSFNQVESWEKLARLVLFDTGDYFQARFGEPEEGRE